MIVHYGGQKSNRDIFTASADSFAQGERKRVCERKSSYHESYELHMTQIGWPEGQ